MVIITGQEVFKVKIEITDIATSEKTEKVFLRTEKSGLTNPTVIGDFSNCLASDTSKTYALLLATANVSQVDKEVLPVVDADNIYDNFGSIYEQI